MRDLLKYDERLLFINSREIAQFVASCSKVLDNDFSYNVISMNSRRNLSVERFADFSRLTASLGAAGSISIRGGAGASPGSPINRASSDPQKRDDVVKGEVRSRRGAKAALGGSLLG